MNLIDQLRDMGNDLNERIPELNYGGCAVYAALVGKRLIELGVPHVRARVSGWTSRAVHANYDYKDLLSNDIGITHVFLTFKWDELMWSHDSEATYPKVIQYALGEPVYAGALTIARTTRLANTAEWNRMFDRVQGIPIIKSAITEYLPYESVYAADRPLGPPFKLTPRAKRLAYPDVEARPRARSVEFY